MRASDHKFLGAPAAERIICNSEYFRLLHGGMHDLEGDTAALAAQRCDRGFHSVFHFYSVFHFHSVKFCLHCISVNWENSKF